MRADDDIPGDPDLEDDHLAERGRALVAAAVADVRAPLPLRERLEHQRTATAPARRRRRAALGALLAGGTAMVLALALLVLPGGTPGAPSVVEAARLGVKPPEEGAPARDSANPRLLLAEEAGIRFPAWQAFDWNPTGKREDELDGRDVTTVFYKTAKGAPVAYSIVDGDALDRPSGTTKDVEGVDVTYRRDGDRWLVTWERDGHTCIITAPAKVPLDKLLELPGWE
ncbi:MAG: hypothetical protein HZB46_18195 [Solirubrobacterales bacterium]|nr:hypothetical protein [Solirubrobacterales bacterium]